jgi:lysophospholipase L1-like esterase
VPLEEYRANVTQIFRRIRGETDATLIWAATTPANEQRHHATKGFHRFDADVLAYNGAAAEIARGMGIPINDLFDVVTRAGRDTLLLDDGVHFAQAGYELLGKAVADFIRACFRGRC